MKNIYIILTVCTIFTGLILANPNFVGYSGAPASNGTCSSSCHAQNDFTPSCEIIGFPAVYAPGQQYTIIVRHDSGLSIKQFNCSVRKDTDSTIAGVLSEDFATEIYTITNETDGVHWSDVSLDSGSFIWTAPDTLTGFVTLYWAGLQGSRANGANQLITIMASEEGNSIDYALELPLEFSLSQNYPNPFNSSTIIEMNIAKPDKVIFQVINILGQIVYDDIILDVHPGNNAICWDGRGLNGDALPSGLYFYLISSGANSAFRKMIILR